MLPLRRIADLPDLVFFTDRYTPPRQVPPGAGELRNPKLGALVARLGTTQRAALFARTVLLVEGPSDQTIVAALAARVKRSLGGAGVEVVPVAGKGGMPDAARLFRLMGKRVVVLADGNALVNAFAKEAAAAAAEKGHVRGVAAMDQPLRADFAGAVEERWPELEQLVLDHRYLARLKEADLLPEEAREVRRRAALVALLSEDPTPLEALSGSTVWQLLRRAFIALLEVLEVGGCFVLRRGTIEDCYANPLGTSAKLAAADEEVALLADADEEDVRRRYADALRAIEAAVPGSPVDEHAFLREHLAALLGATFARLDAGTTAEELGRVAAGTQSAGASIFTLKNASSSEPNGRRALQVGLASPLFAAKRLPAVIGREENMNAVVEHLLPSHEHGGGEGAE